MPNFRRFYIPNSIIFITCVTKERRPILKGDKEVDVFWDTLKKVQCIHQFNLLAYVILFDHFHWLMRMPEENPDFSKVLHSVKRNFTFEFKKLIGVTDSFHLWQDRYWDHVIRNEIDLDNHMGYIHWNPVKHGYVQMPEDWMHSSYSFWQKKGYYPDGWGETQPMGMDEITAE